jgi:hypothetical protein
MKNTIPNHKLSLPTIKSEVTFTGEKTSTKEATPSNSQEMTILANTIETMTSMVTLSVKTSTAILTTTSPLLTTTVSITKATVGYFNIRSERSVHHDYNFTTYIFQMCSDPCISFKIATDVRNNLIPPIIWRNDYKILIADIHCR